MNFKITGLALVGLIAAAPMSGSLAQEALAPGANSFTEGQARGRIEEAGFGQVTDLRKDDQGIWRGRATRNGSPTEVGVDFKGNVVAGAAAPSGAGNNAVNVGPARDGALGANTPDGTPGNPPGTAVGRATDRALGTNTPDGAPGNPPGTAAGRALDNTLGTNTTGANPGAGGPDGTRGNPPSTAVGRAVDQMQGQTPRPDGTSGNPPGTAVGRALGTDPSTTGGTTR